MNTILIVLIVVVIYLIFKNMSKKEDFNNSYINPYDYLNYHHNENNCDNIRVNDCDNPYFRNKCYNKCLSYQQR